MPWLHYIHHRKPHHERESRLWFKPEHFITEQFHKVREATKNRLERSIEAFIKEMFLTYRLGEFRLPVAWLTKSLNEEGKYKTDVLEVRTYLKEKRGMEPEKLPRRNRIPNGFKEAMLAGDKEEINYDTTGTSRPYTFTVTDWLSEEELQDFGHAVKDEGEEKDLF